MSSHAAVLDTRRRVETPEGVELDLAVAGPVSRASAWLIDSLIRTAVWFAVSVALVPMGPAGQGIALVAFFLLGWGYPVLFELVNRGATPGKSLLGLEVVHDDGTPVRLSASVVRNLLRAVDALPVAYAFGLTACVLSRDFKRLGDLAAGTVVVYSGKVRARRVTAEAPPLPPPVPLTAEERRAVMDFAERAVHLSPERAEELAACAEPLAGRGRDAVLRLAGMAAWLSGRR